LNILDIIIIYKCIIIYYSSATEGTMYFPFFQQPENLKLLARHRVTYDSLARYPRILWNN